MMRPLLFVLLVLFAVAAPRAQQATFTPFGTACTFPGEPTPAIGARGLPRIGTSFDITYQGPNRAPGGSQQSVQPFLVTGLQLFSAPVPVPTFLFPQQTAGCLVYVFPDIVLPMPIARGGMVFESSFTWAIPNDPALVGATWFHQWLAIFEQCGFAGCDYLWSVTSDAAHVVAGT